ncbi:MAG TPA: YbjQ family protein [Gemmobacter sp.]|nr:YbjQ family protein [Gemmobacter sp.]HBU13771.1 YbjQ family protein [Gemmobacter sp.]
MANCSACDKKLMSFALADGLCGDCYNQRANDQRDAKLAALAKAKAPQVIREDGASRIMLTTETAHNLPVAQRLDIVTAEIVIGMNVFKDVASAFRDVFGGRSETMQRGLKQARKAALAELRQEAFDLGADAVVGVDLDYSEISGGGKSMLFLVASGTAVKLHPPA